MSLDYNNSTFKGSDCITIDVVKEGVCSLNPSLIQAVNKCKEKISGLNNGNGNIHSFKKECSLSLSFNQTNDQTVSQEKMVPLISLKNTVEADRKNVDCKELFDGTGLQDRKGSDDSDFDIDDFSENDIQDYCEQPAALSVSRSSSALPLPFCERGISNYYDKKNVITPTAVLMPIKPCFLG